jgi:hypothetical protein
MSRARRERRRRIREGRAFRKFVVVRIPGRKPIRIETSGCCWCTDECICSHHGTLADKVREKYARVVT